MTDQEAIEAHRQLAAYHREQAMTVSGSLAHQYHSEFALRLSDEAKRLSERQQIDMTQ